MIAVAGDAERKRQSRAAARDLQIPRVRDVARRRACLADVYLFHSAYFGGIFFQPFTESRRQMVDAIVTAASTSGDQAIAGPRGDGKTRCALFTALWLALTGRSDFPLIISKSGDRAELELKNLKWAIRESDVFAADFPEIATPIEALGGWASRARQQTVWGEACDMEWGVRTIALPTISTEHLESHGWNKGVGSVACGQIFASLGVEGPIRGYSVRNRRPTLAIIDDIDDRESADSVAQTEKRIEIIDADVAGLGGPDRNVSRVMLCTLINRRCAAYVFTDPKQRPSFRGQRHRLITKLPDRVDLWESYVALRSGRDDKADPDARQAHTMYVERRAEMDSGHEASNPFRFNTLPLADGEPAEVSALQSYYNFVADKGLTAALTELQNDPPPDEDGARLILTAYHVRANARSGLARGVVPDDTVAITVGCDVQKLGLHHATIAWNERAAGAIIDYDFWPFDTQGRKASACEVLILEGLQAWWEARSAANFRQVDGIEWTPDLTVIDSGWKDDGWNTQPVYLFCAEVGLNLAVPSKGIPGWRPKKAGPNCKPGENYNLVATNGVLLAELNADHWKIKVHEGFLQSHPEPGSLALFTPPRDEWGREPANYHLAYAKHVTSERWAPKGANGSWAWQPADGSRHQKPNHWLDATAYAVAARVMWGVQTIKPQAQQPSVVVSPSAPVEVGETGGVYSPLDAGRGGRNW